MLTQFPQDTILKEKYHIIRPLGQGGMGITYAAQNLENQEAVAIKAISLISSGQLMRTDLLEKEVTTLKKLNHPNIPSYLDSFVADGDGDRIFYLVQELAEGKNLEEWVKEGWRFTEAEVKKIATNLLETLVYLHSFDPPLIHRDIKPQNIVRSPEGKIFLVDFASVQNTYYGEVRRGNTTIGTFGYMPLEQASGQAVPASDLYSLGATLLFLLTHRPPQELSEDGLTFNFRAQVQVSEEFADWLEKMLEPEVEERFSSAAEALRALLKPKLVREGRLSQRRWMAWWGLGLATVAGMTLFVNHKWRILVALGFPPPSRLCTVRLDDNITFDYIINGAELGPISVVQCYNWFKSAILDPNLNPEVKKIIKEAIKKADFNANRRIFNNSSHKQWDIHAEIGDKVDKEIVELFIAHIVNVNLKAEDKETLLHLAVVEQNKEIVEFLIAIGVDVNAKSNRLGYTPLPVVADGLYFEWSNGHRSSEAVVAAVEMAQLLITLGADVNAKTNYFHGQQTPLDLARYEKIKELLKKHGAK